MPVTPTANLLEHQFEAVVWTNETGTGVQGTVARYTDITIQATGTGTVTIEGSNNGTNWVALNDTSGAAISLAAASNAMGVLKEHPYYIRPVVAGGTATIIALASGNR